MANRKFDQQLAALETLRQTGASPATAAELRKALLNRNNYIVAKAAKVVSQLGLKELVPDMVSAMDRFFTDAAKSDPQCWAKHALAQALGELGHKESAAFLRGLRHVQMEAVWGGQEDTAARVRSACALALVECRDLSDLDLLAHLVELLVDRDKTVRVDAARAIGMLERREAALLLRLRALVGDKEPEVIGACFSAALSIEGAAAIDFVRGFFDAGEDTAAEAALALAQLHSPEAFRVLKERFAQEGNTAFGAVLLSAIALTRQPEAFDFLLHLVETDATGAAAALRALASAHLSPAIHDRVTAAAQRSGNPRLRTLLSEL